MLCTARIETQTDKGTRTEYSFLWGKIDEKKSEILIYSLKYADK